PAAARAAEDEPASQACQRDEDEHQDDLYQHETDPTTTPRRRETGDAPTSAELVYHERGREPERRHDSDELACVSVGLRHHRVGEHRQDWAGGEGEDECDDVG